MSDLSDKVIVAKNALMTALGDNSAKYMENMRFWFKAKWSKEEFDIESRKLLPAEKIHLHNQFLLAILNKIDSLSVPQPSAVSASTSSTANRSNRKRKRSSRLTSEKATFEPLDPLEYSKFYYDFIPPNSDDGQPPNVAERSCVQELFLPDAGFIIGRFLIGAWECGLVNVDDNVAEYVVSAVQTLLKNVLSAIILQRKHYRVTGDGSYFYDVGAPLKDLFLRNTVTKNKVTDIPQEIDKEITTMSIARRAADDSIFLSACEEVYPSKKRPITVNDVYKIFSDKRIISSHTIHSINMERLSQMLH